MKQSLFKSVFILAAMLLFTGDAIADVPTSIQQMQLSFAPLVKRAAPAVVNIYAKHVEQVRAISPLFNDPFFNQFFNAPQFGGPARQRIEQSLGSGVIVSDDGMIATNHHVIKDATEINVVISDGREFTAHKVLDDERTDLAILKINVGSEKLPVLPLADSDAVQVGDLVLAIGNPFGLEQTVTHGIVSGLARTDIGVSDYKYFIQTDAPINPGNSGGALIDMQGRLIGINSEIYSNSGGSLGIGFAIPSNMVKTIIAAAQHGGAIHRAWTGMVGQNITPDMMQSLKLKNTQGSLTARVAKGSPAEKAGIKVGDVILAINGKEVQDPVALKFRLAEVPIGSPIKLQISRNGRIFDVMMTAAVAPENPPRDQTLVKGANPFAGAEIVNISPAVTEEMGNLGTDSGVVIYKVQGSTAGSIGLQRGDVVVSMNGEKIISVNQFVKLLRGQRVPQWQIRLRRKGQTINLNISG